MTLPDPFYADDAIALYCAEALTLLLELDDGTVDAVITDAPYSSGGQFRGDRAAKVLSKYHATETDGLAARGFTGDNRDQRAFAYWCTLWLDQARRVLRPGGIVALFTDWRQLPTFTDAMQAGGLIWRGIVPWDKTGAARPALGRYTAQCEYVVWGTNGERPLAGTCGPGIIRAAPPRGPDRLHFTQKPVSVVHGLLTILDPGSLILDPFAGSGTTLVAAKAAGHRALGVELDPVNCATAARRLAAGVLDFPDVDEATA